MPITRGRANGAARRYPHESVRSIRSELTFCLTLITADERRMGRTDRLINEHRAIRDAIVTRDSALAGRLVGEHLDFHEAETRRSLANRP